MAADQFTVRSGTADDFDDLFLVLQRAFNDDPDDAERDDERQVYEPDRSILAYRGDALAGTAAAYTRELTVPGGVVPAAHVSMVGVDPTFRRRFQDEGRVWRELSHENIVRLFDAGEVEARPYLAMEFIDGRDLAQVWRQCTVTRLSLYRFDSTSPCAESSANPLAASRTNASRRP